MPPHPCPFPYHTLDTNNIQPQVSYIDILHCFPLLIFHNSTVIFLSPSQERFLKVDAPLDLVTKLVLLKYLVYSIHISNDRTFITSEKLLC